MILVLVCTYIEVNGQRLFWRQAAKKKKEQIQSNTKQKGRAIPEDAYLSLSLSVSAQYDLAKGELKSRREAPTYEPDTRTRTPPPRPRPNDPSACAGGNNGGDMPAPPGSSCFSKDSYVEFHLLAP